MWITIASRISSRRLAFEAGIAEDHPVGSMLSRLYEVFVQEDAMLVEVSRCS